MLLAATWLSKDICVKIMKKILLIVTFLVSIFLVSPPVYSQSPEDQYQMIKKQIEELEKKIADLKNQAKTLSNQIAYMDNQIKLTSLKISQTEKEITDLTTKIGRLDVSLDQMAVLLNQRIAATYVEGKIDPITLLFSSRKFSDFIVRYKYLKVVQIHDRQLLYEMETTRTDYDEQKTEVEALKKKLESQKELLAKQKKDKEYLLQTTKNDEKKYQEMLAAARAEQAAIEKILSGQGNVAKVGPVNSGDTIGLYISGSSPCSSGTHLHFEVTKDGVHQNPANYLRNISLKFQSNVAQFTPSGSWDWPIVEPIIVTQEYGSTFWSRLGWYSGGIHTGIDMVSGTYDNPGPRIVRSVQAGTLNKGSIKCGKGELKYARVDHDGGLQTYYLHVE